MKNVTKINLAKLKVKNISLADESRTIRRIEKQFVGDERDQLVEHRRGIVRDESRATHIAVAFLKGKPYDSVERNAKRDYNQRKALGRAHRLVNKYSRPGITVTIQDLVDWSEK